MVHCRLRRSPVPPAATRSSVAPPSTTTDLDDSILLGKVTPVQLADGNVLVTCTECSKPILESAVEIHARTSLPLSSFPSSGRARKRVVLNERSRGWRQRDLIAYRLLTSSSFAGFGFAGTENCQKVRDRARGIMSNGDGTRKRRLSDGQSALFFTTTLARSPLDASTLLLIP